MHRKEGLSTPAEFMITPTVTWADVDTDEATLGVLTDLVRDVTPAATGRRAKATGRPAGAPLALFLGEGRRQRRLAAEATAQALNSPLLRVDLGAVDSRWLQETEANLNRVFASAEKAGAVLLLDEADALMGRRTEVKDSHDRFTNEATGHLLTLVDGHQHLCIVAMAKRQNIDPAFIRRVRAEVRFP